MFIETHENPSWRDGLAAWSTGLKESSSTFWNSTTYAFGAFQKDSNQWLQEHIRPDDWGSRVNNITQTLIDNAAIAAANDFAKNWGQNLANSAALTAVREFMESLSKPTRFALAGGAAFGGLWIFRGIFSGSSFEGEPEFLSAAEQTLSSTLNLDWKHNMHALKQEITQLKWELSTERRLAFEYDQLRIQAENELLTTKARLEELRDLLDRLLGKNVQVSVTDGGNLALGGGSGDSGGDGIDSLDGGPRGGLNSEGGQGSAALAQGVQTEDDNDDDKNDNTEESIYVASTAEDYPEVASNTDSYYIPERGTSSLSTAYAVDV